MFEQIVLAYPAMLLLIAVPLGPALAWKRGDLAAALQRLWFAALITLLVVVAVFAYAYRGPWLAPLAIGLGVWVMAAALQDLFLRAKFGEVPFATASSRMASTSSPRSMPRYRRLVGLFRDALSNGIIIAAQSEIDRQRFVELGARCGARVGIVACEADTETLKQRIRRRMGAGRDASDADIAVLEHQLDAREPLDEAEQRLVLHPDGGPSFGSLSS